MRTALSQSIQTIDAIWGSKGKGKFLSINSCHWLQLQRFLAHYPKPLSGCCSTQTMWQQWLKPTPCMVVAPQTAHLLRCLPYFLAQTDCRIQAVHMPGHLNINADDLSWNLAERVCQRFLLLSSLPTQVPQELLDLLFQGSPAWVSPDWRQLWSSFWMWA